MWPIIIGQMALTQTPQTTAHLGADTARGETTKDVERFRQFLDHGAPGPLAYVVLLGLDTFAAQDLLKTVGKGLVYRTFERLQRNTDLPLESMYRHARAARIYDGPDEVHKVTVARQLLKGYRPSDPPTEHIPTRRAAALEKYAAYLDEVAVSS